MSAQRPPEWEPEPLRLPAEPPARRAPSAVEQPIDHDSEGIDQPRSGDRVGSHVIVIDIA